MYVMRELVYTQHGYAGVLFTHSCLSKASEKILSMCEIRTQNLEALYLILNTDERSNQGSKEMEALKIPSNPGNPSKQGNALQSTDLISSSSTELQLQRVMEIVEYG